MAATDITALVAEQPGTRAFESPARMVGYKIDVLNSAFSGIEGVFTHPLVTILKGDAYIGGFAVVEKAFTSGGAATLQFLINGDAITGLIPKADLTVGEVIALDLNDIDGVAGANSFASAADITFDWKVATAALTAGAIRLYVATIDNIT